MGIGGLDDGVQAAQVVAMGAGDTGVLQRVQNRLVVLVDQHHHAALQLPVERLDEVAKARRPGIVARGDAVFLRQAVQVRHHFVVQAAG